MTVHSREELLRQIAFIAYYFQWSEVQIMNLSHIERRRYCEEISRINRKLNGGTKNPFEI